jgi:hypothetical protein
VQEGIGKITTQKRRKKNKEKNSHKKQVSPSEKPMLIRRGADKREKNKEKEEKRGQMGRVGMRRVEERDRVS